ncbi:MAG: hypothetical protein CSYNP_01589 [Syntrophus sp. SKADARSKE-3]|nr:hypothetical protein [Syntrophus sp. SKADARSKE-3]
MPYCSLTDLEKLMPTTMIISMSNDVGGATTVDMTNLTEAIDQADREIDAYLVIAGESVPMDPVPPLIANLSAKMARWNLCLRKLFSNASWENEYLRCQKLLEKIAARKLSVGQIEEGVAVSGVGTISVSARPQRFTDAIWRTY